jgi:hypothetical protein
MKRSSSSSSTSTNKKQKSSSSSEQNDENDSIMDVNSRISLIKQAIKGLPTSDVVKFYSKAVPLVIEQAHKDIGSNPTQKNKKKLVHKIVHSVLVTLSDINPPHPSSSIEADVFSQHSNTSNTSLPDIDSILDEVECGDGIGGLLLGAAKVGVHHHKHVRQGLVWACRHDARLLRQVRLFKEEDEEIQAFHKACATWRRKVSNADWRNLRIEVGGIGCALFNMGLTDGFNLIPVFSSRHDTDSYLSPLMKKVQNSIETAEKCLAAGVFVQMWDPDVGKW